MLVASIHVSRPPGGSPACSVGYTLDVGEWGRPFPKPPQSRPWAALYRICASAAPGWAGSRSSWPGSAGRHPWRAEKPWLEARGSGGAQSGSCSGGRGAWTQRPRLTLVSSATKRAPASAVTPGPRDPHRTGLQCRAALAGNTTGAGAQRRAPSVRCSIS